MNSKFRQYYYEHQENTLHTIKYLLAFLIGYGIMQLLPDGKSQWVIITIAVLMGSQTVIGLQVNRALLRLLGTLVGAALGLLTISLPHYPWITIVAIIVAALFFSILTYGNSDLSYISTLGMTTFAIIALTSKPSYNTAGFRIFDIILGIVISLFVSRLIFPLNSRRAFTIATVSNFSKINQYIEQVFIAGTEKRNNPDLVKLDAKISNAFSKQRQILKGINYESFRKNLIKEKLLLILRYQRATYHYLLFIDTAINDGRRTKPLVIATLMPYITEYMEELMIVHRHIEIEQPTETVEMLTEKLQSIQKTTSKALTSFTLDEEKLQQSEVIAFTMRRINRCCDKLLSTWNEIIQH